MKFLMPNFPNLDMVKQFNDMELGLKNSVSCSL